MIWDHTMYDLAYIFGQKWALAFFNWPLRSIGWWGAVFCFVAISGISSTLSRSNLVRGLQLAGVALLLTLATALMDKFTGQSDVFIVRFGILHMLASCMIIYSFLNNRSLTLRAVLSLATVAVGIYFINFPLDFSAFSEAASSGPTILLKGLGALVKAKGAFYSADYFYLLPWLGFFIFGGILGQLLYSEKQSLKPLKKSRAPVNVIRFVGKYSLFFYVFHQPIIYGLLTLIFSAA